MPRLTREEKKIRRIERLLAPLLTRRQFVLGAGAMGLAVRTPELLAQSVAAIDNPQDAARAGYWSMWNAARTSPDENPRIQGHPPGLDDPLRDAWDQSPYEPGSEDPRPGPAMARHWIIWRIQRNFERRFQESPNAWRQQSDYVLLNSARIGIYARILGRDDILNKGHFVRAFNEVKVDPDPFPRGPAAAPDSVMDLWCF